MNDLSMDMLRLSAKGYACSQILILLALDLQGESNPGLVRAMTGLSHGMGQCGELCGALSGGVCLLGLYAGKGADSELEHEHFQLMVAELVEWFRETPCASCPSMRCEDILGGPEAKPNPAKCGALVMDVYARTMNLLLENGIDPAIPRQEAPAT